MEKSALCSLAITVMYLVSGLSVGICSDGLIRTYVSSTSSNEVSTSNDQLVYSAPLKVPEINGSEWDPLVVQSPIRVFVEFTAPWCDDCRKIEPIINQLAQEFAGKCNFYKLDVYTNQEIAIKYRVGNVPNFMIIVKGDKGASIPGMTSPEYLRHFIEMYCH